MKFSKPLVSIIIPTANAKAYLDKCLASILISDYKNHEIIVVDNGSTDGTVQFIKQKYPRIILVELDQNYGPAKARNEGVKIAKGKYLGFLDSDTKVDKGWVLEALKIFQQDRKIAAVQCKLLSLVDKKSIDYVGEYLGSLGFLVSVAKRGEADRGQFDSQNNILAAKSAGMFIRKDVFEKVGGFDEDYFIFVEETDLGWRCWLSGFRVVFCPKSIVYHHFSASKDIFDKNFNNYLVRFHGCKNYILTLYKNLSTPYLFKILPVHVFLWLGLSLYLLVKGNFRSAANIMQAIVWNLSNLKDNTRKRKIIQAKRVISDETLFKNYGLMKGKNLFYFIGRFIQSQKTAVTPENQR